MPRDPHPTQTTGSHDDRLAVLLRIAAGEHHLPDRRALLQERIEGRRRRSRARVSVSVAAVVALGVIAGAVNNRAEQQQQSVASGPLSVPFERVDRTIEPGLRLVVFADGQELRIELGDVRARAPLGASPLSPYEPFGSVRVGDHGRVTGATHSTVGEDLTPVVVVAVSADQTVSRARLVDESSGRIDLIDVQSSVGVLALSLAEHDPQVRVRIDLLGAGGEVIGSEVIYPFVQVPWTCETNTRMAEVSSDGPSDGQPASGSARHFAAPLPAVCG
jgi:hypothetical protein